MGPALTFQIAEEDKDPPLQLRDQNRESHRNVIQVLKHLLHGAVSLLALEEDDPSWGLSMHFPKF